MGSNTLIIREYLESLKEDGELDSLFPILLNLMGFRVVSTPRHSKGQPQYGKDVIAIGLDTDNVRKRFYFELKGHDDKDIDDVVFNKPDGIRESLQAAKDAAFNDSSIPDFNDLPIKIVLVHNGIVKSNFLPQLEGFVRREFADGSFERWDIYKLTELFGQFLFGEYLLTDEESVRLFKRTLVLLDAPEYDFSDFKRLVDIQLGKTNKVKGRSFKKLFATLNLLSVIIHHYSRENESLTPARECLTYLTLKTWNWILNNRVHDKRPVLRQFMKIVRSHYNMLDEYFKKTLPFAMKHEGLFSERGGPYEVIGYPIRSFEFLNYLVYYFEAEAFFRKQDEPSVDISFLRRYQKATLRKLINENIGTKRPIIDKHLISILNVFLFVLRHRENGLREAEFLKGYLVDLFNNILLTYAQHKRLPELRNNIKALSDFICYNKRPEEYEDRSSLLMTILFELAVVLNLKDVYESFRIEFSGKVNLQTAMSNANDEDLEPLLYERNLHDALYVESSIELPESFEDFRSALLAKNVPLRTYKASAAGLDFIRILALIYFDNEFLPDDWRKFILQVTD